MPEYSLTGRGKINALSIEYNKNENNINSNEFTGNSNSYRRNVNNHPIFFNKNSEKDSNSKLYHKASNTLLSNIEINDNFVEQQNNRQMPFTYVVGYNDEIFAPSADSSFCNIFFLYLIFY